MMSAQTTQSDKAPEPVKETYVPRPRNLGLHGVPQIYLSRLYTAGKLWRVGQRLYVLPRNNITKHHTLAEVFKPAPHGSVCLLSARCFHKITTQTPFEVWLAIDVRAWKPKLEHPPTRITHFSKATLHANIEEHWTEGVATRAYAPAKTIADCFKYRNIGLDVAIEAPRECWRTRRRTVDELWHDANTCQVRNSMRPYLKAVAA